MSCFDGGWDDFDFVSGLFILGEIEAEEKRDALAGSGLDEFELALMDDNEREATLLEAGLDPSDYEW